MWSGLVRAFVAAADCCKSGTWNVGTGTEATVLDLIAIIDDIAGRTVTPPDFVAPRPGELLRSAVAPGLAIRDLGWRPSTALMDGVRKVHRWIGAGSPVKAAW